MKYQTILNANFSQSGSGSSTVKISFPLSTLNDMGITNEDRAIEMQYNPISKEITLKKYTPLEPFDMKFEYKFVEKINECYDKIMEDYFFKTGLTGSKWTFSRTIGGQTIKNNSCKRTDQLLFDNKIAVQVVLYKNKISLFIDNSLFIGKFLFSNIYQDYLNKLSNNLEKLAIENNMTIEKYTEITNYN